MNLNEFLFEAQTFSSKKLYWKMLFAKLCPFCLGLNMFAKRKTIQYMCNFISDLYYQLVIVRSKLYLKPTLGYIIIQSPCLDNMGVKFWYHCLKIKTLQ